MDFYHLAKSPCGKLESELLVHFEDVQLSHKEPIVDYKVRSFEAHYVHDLEKDIQIEVDHEWMEKIAYWGWQNKAEERVWKEEWPEKWAESDYREWMTDKVMRE